LFTDFFRRLLQVFTIGLIATVLYLNILNVPRGHVVFLDKSGSESSGDLVQFESGTHFVPTLFVPGRWRRFSLDRGVHLQDIHLKLPLKYSAYLRLSDYFYIKLRLKIEGEIPPAQARVALAALGARPLDRDKIVEEEILYLASEFLLEKKIDEQNLDLIKTELGRFFAASNLANLQGRLNIQLKIPWYTLRRAELKEIHVPETQVYLAQTRNLGEVAATDRRSLLKQIEKDSDLALERKRNLEDLSKAEKMSALLAENPDLLEYYKIEKIAPRAGSVILDASSRGRKAELIINPTQSKDQKRGIDGKGEKDGDEAGGEIGQGSAGDREKRPR